MTQHPSGSVQQRIQTGGEGTVDGPAATPESETQASSLTLQTLKFLNNMRSGQKVSLKGLYSPSQKTYSY